MFFHDDLDDLYGDPYTQLIEEVEEEEFDKELDLEEKITEYNLSRELELRTLLGEKRYEQMMIRKHEAEQKMDVI